MYVEGIVGTLQRPAIECPSYHPTGNVVPACFAKSTTPLDSSFTLTPTTWTRPGYLLATASSAGNDFLHGAHHVAQKSTRTTLPWRSCRRTSPFPLRLWIARSGAG